MNELTGATMPLRTKEDAEDYRYMPDANLPALVIEQVCGPL
jgi:aspartyl-tRNA(Asn)/glutamyl-tRNA(Gln) amidotransferase subunit B